MLVLSALRMFKKYKQLTWSWSTEMTKVPCRNSDVLTRSVYTHRTTSYQERGWKEVSLKNDQGVWIFSYDCFQVSRLRSEMKVLLGHWLV